ncbi:MAG TPA: sulfite exporter TauE/SafE family protein [Nitrososphaerales archaeon]|nr:sulfite exporter TauE/SafE family protein [Nitrososphaerales archaeon]
MAMLNLFEVLLFAVAAGLVGSMTGLGGAVVVTPLLVFFGVPIKYAIAASMVCIIATSSGSASSYVRDGLSNVRAAFFLEIFTAVGAIVGAVITSFLSPTLLYFFFAAFLMTSFAAVRRRQSAAEEPVKQDAWAKSLQLSGSYFDRPTGKQIRYELHRPFWAAPGMFVAGLAAGMLGIGAGAFKVSIHEVILGMPSKVSTATSNFIIGMTALAGASVYFSSGLLYLNLAAPLAIGTTAGAFAGSRVLRNLRNETVRTLFLVVLAVVIVEMLYKGLTSL